MRPEQSNKENNEKFANEKRIVRKRERKSERKHSRIQALKQCQKVYMQKLSAFTNSYGTERSLRLNGENRCMAQRKRVECKEGIEISHIRRSAINR